MTGRRKYAFASSKIVCLLLLYFVQGIPYGFQARFLPIYLRSQGTSLTSLGLFKVLLLPWMLKVLWAPFLERRVSRRASLVWSLLAMAGVCAAAASLVSPAQTLALCVVVFSLNLAASVQDIAVDGTAIAILATAELGAGNTVQVVGYKAGSVVGGGLLVWLIDFTGWRGMFLLLAAVYVLAVFVALALDELKPCNTDGANGTPCQEDSVRHRQGSKLDDSIKDLVRNVLNTPQTKWMMTFVIFYKLGEQGATGMFPLYLVDHGVPVNEVGFQTGVISQGLSIAGSLAGGWMLSSTRLSLTAEFLLPYLMKLRLLPIMFQTVVICLNQSETSVPFYGACMVAACLLQLLGGAVTICTFTLMMRCSQRAAGRLQATHYTALATLEVMGKLTFMSVAGWLVDWLGYANMFCLFSALSAGILAMFRPETKSYLL